ncbi:MAG: helix-turn-helix domain-containing protein [Anaerolineae bacterium]|nr:helix-turn-helix domain-containing protein [Anaerolineae bacterium]NUQ02285.1 helix-turn-helix domain-containing protein [Anaerolineae bacterium]
MTEPERITVEDVRKLALPLGTRIAAGEGLLQSRVITWAAVIYTDDGLLSKSGHEAELILVAPAEGPNTPRLRDVDIVRWASEQQASAVVLHDSPSSTAIAEANAYGIPLLVLPSGSRIRVVEKVVVSLLVDHKGQLERRGTQIYRQLTQITSRNEGMAELVSEMARLTNKSVVVQDKRLQMIVSSVQPQFVAFWDEVETFLRKLDNLPVEMQDRLRVSEMDNPVLMQSLPTTGIARYVAPVVTKEIGRGYLSIIGFDSDLDEVDLLVAEHGAAACAIEMAKAKAISDAEKRLRGTFLDRLLFGDVSQQEALQQGERLEHDMSRPHIAVVLKWQGEKAASMRRLETIVNTVVSNTKAHALVWQREKENEVIVFLAIDEQDAVISGMKLSKAFPAEVQRQYPGYHVAVGVGQPATDVANWRRSYGEAVQARDLAVRLHSDTPLYIGDLGVYQLLIRLNDKERLMGFCEQTLGPLIDYDMRQHADLVKTLEAFFQCHGNLSETAKQLIVHRNTLLYRMNRINEIAGVDLDRPEIRLAFHLALTIRRLLSAN